MPHKYIAIFKFTTVYNCKSVIIMILILISSHKKKLIQLTQRSRPKPSSEAHHTALCEHRQMHKREY